MEVTLYIRRSSGLVFASGNTSASLNLKLGETLILHLAFVDDRGSVVALPSGATGLLRTVPTTDPAGTPRFAVNGWTVAGTGSTRRYTFTGIVWRNILATDLATSAEILLNTQIEYTAAGQTSITDTIPTLIAKTAFAGGSEIVVQPSDVALAWLAGQAVLFTDPDQVISEEQAADVRAKLGIESGGVTDHGALDGLGDDDHTQYHNDARGDARYTAIAHATATDNPHAVTKAQVGLGNVDNTSDAGKPISTATQTALDAHTTALAAKAPLASPALTGTPTAPTASVGTNTTQIATTAHVKASIDALVAGAPGALDTLNEIAAQLATDESAVSALTTTVAGKAAASRTISAAGLATGGGSLAADRTITVPIASQAEAEAGSSNAVAMTPLRTAQAIAELGGGGGGAALVRGSGTVQGYTTLPTVYLYAVGGYDFVQGNMSGHLLDGTPFAWDFFFDLGGVGGGVGTEVTLGVGLNFAAQLANGIADAFALANPAPGVSAVYDDSVAVSLGYRVVFSNALDFNGVLSTSQTALSFGGSGGVLTVTATASGAVEQVELIAAATGKTPSLVQLMAHTVAAGLSGGTLDIGYFDGAALNTLVSLDMSSYPTRHDLLSCGVVIEDLIADRSGQSLVARFTGTVPVGGRVDILVNTLAV